MNSRLYFKAPELFLVKRSLLLDNFNGVAKLIL